MLSKTLLRIAILGLFCAAAFSCEKELPVEETEIPGVGIANERISISEAKGWFQSHARVASRDTGSISEITALSVTPNWFEARVIPYMEVHDLITVPFLDSLNWEYEEIASKNLVLYKDCNGKICARLLYFVPESEYAISTEGNYSVSDFSGVTFQIDEEGNYGKFGIIQEGEIVSQILVDTAAIERYNPPVEARGPECPRFAPSWIGQLVQGIFHAIGEFLSGITTGDWDFGDGPVYISSTAAQEWGNFFSNSNMGGGFNPNILNSFFSNQLFNAAPIQEYEQCLDSYAPGQSMPLMLATGGFRGIMGQNIGSSSPWGIHMIQAINLFVQGNASGTAESFDDILAGYEVDHEGLYYVPIYPNQAAKQALVSVFTNMTASYENCLNRANQELPHEGEFFFDFSQDEFCDCIAGSGAGYTAEDAIIDFFNEYYQLENSSLARFIALERPDLLWRLQAILNGPGGITASSLGAIDAIIEYAEENQDNPEAGGVIEAVLGFLEDKGFNHASINAVNKALSLDIENFPESLNALYSLYEELNNKALFESVDAEQLQFFIEHPDFNQLACVDGLLGDYSSCNEEDIGPVAIWLLKKAAQFGAGAIIDICIQLGLEKWLGGHDSWPAAWEALDVNEWQVLGAAIDASISGKYAPIAATFTSVSSYLLSTPLEQITFQEIFQQAAVGALSGYIGSNAGSYVNKIRQYFPDYGFLIPYQGLSNMGIKPFFLNLPDFRRDAIFYVWRDLGNTTTKGFYFEEILSYGRYQGYTWVNGGGELNGPIDFFLDDLAVQLKSTQNANPAQWSNFLNNTVKPGLNQLINAVDNGFQGNNFTQGRLDIMIPESLEGNIPQLEGLIENWLPTADNYANYNFEIIIGVFND